MSLKHLKHPIPSYLFMSNKQLKTNHSKLIGGIAWLFYSGLFFSCIILSINVIWRAIFRSSFVCRLITVIYSIWYIYDRETPFNGRERRSKFLFNMIAPIIKACYSYFDPKLIYDFDHSKYQNIKESTGKPAVLCCHPHGIISLGILSNFGITGGTIIFKDPVTVLTLDLQFRVPIWREFCIAVGCASVSRPSIQSLMKKRKDFLIVIGGARESLDAHPGKIMELTVKPRKGIFKLILQYGGLLFPVLTFGELDLYKQVRYPWIRKLQLWLLKVIRVAFPIFWGKYGIIPHHYQLVTIIGEPLDVEALHRHPTEAEVRALQETYIHHLENLFRKHCQKYSNHTNVIIK